MKHRWGRPQYHRVPTEPFLPDESYWTWFCDDCLSSVLVAHSGKPKKADLRRAGVLINCKTQLVTQVMRE